MSSSSFVMEGGQLKASPNRRNSTSIDINL